MLQINKLFSGPCFFNVANRFSAISSRPLIDLFCRTVRNPLFIGSACAIGGGLGYSYWKSRKNVQVKPSSEQKPSVAVVPALPLGPEIDTLSSAFHAAQRTLFSYAANVPRNSMEEHSLKFYL
jgi:hypothetical protein